MAFESLEFTVEDILNLHRDWITQLYVHDRKTEVEIIRALNEGHLVVTLAEIQRCIREWELIQPPAVSDTAASPSPTLSDDWELVSTPPKLEAPTQGSYTPSDPSQITKYTEKPLPSLPTPKIYQNTSKIQKRRPSSITDRLKLTCHHGPSSSDVHEVQTSLKLIPEGASPLETYVDIEQTHERIALGLDSALEEDVLKGYRRANSQRPNLPRYHSATVRRVVRDSNPNRGGSNRSWMRKPQQKEDDQERKERKKTPPSPCDEA